MSYKHGKMLFTQGSLLATLMILFVLGAGAIGAIAVLSARRGEGTDDSETDVVTLAAIEAERASLERRRMLFTKRYPEWAGRDFESDPSSPWYADPDFARAR